MDCRADELDYAEDSEVDSMLAAEQTSAEHIVVQSLQLPNGEVCPVVMNSGVVSQPVSLTGATGESELDLKLTPDTLDHLRPGRAVIYRFEERGEIWLVQPSSADPTVLQVQATLDTGQLHYQQQHVHHIDASALPMAALQTIDVGGTVSMEMAGEELVGSEVTEVGGMAEVTSTGEAASAMVTSDDHVDSHHSQMHHQLPTPVGTSHLNAVAHQGSGAAMVHEHDQVQNIHDQLPSLLESDTGPLVGAEETTSVISKSVIGAVPINPVVTSVLQKKLTQADRTPLAIPGARGTRGRQGGPVHQCGECGASFGSMFHLRRHQQTHTGARPFACSICSLSFRHKTSLTVHIRRHTGEMPFNCTVCSKRFRDPANFKVHVRSHTDEKNYECKLCNKRFNSASTLYAHNKTHENVKPYTCNDCKKSFRFNTTLVRHIRTHTGEKPYACERCELCFATASNLAAHRRRHGNASSKKDAGKSNAGGPMYQCGECGQSFHTKPGLKVHDRQQHQAEIQADPESAAAPSSEKDLASSTETTPEATPVTAISTDTSSWDGATIVLQCSICSEVFISERQISEHMASHRHPQVNAVSNKGASPKASKGDVGRERTKQKARGNLQAVPPGSSTIGKQRGQPQREQPQVPHSEGAGVLQGAKESAGDSGSKSLRCDTCGKRFESADMHTAHMRTHNISKGIRVVYTVRSVC